MAPALLIDFGDAAEEPSSPLLFSNALIPNPWSAKPSKKTPKPSEDTSITPSLFDQPTQISKATQESLALLDASFGFNEGYRRSSSTPSQASSDGPFFDDIMAPAAVAQPVVVPPPQINVQAPQVSVQPRQIKVQPQEIKVQPPKIKVQTPQINAQSSQIKVQSQEIKSSKAHPATALATRTAEEVAEDLRNSSRKFARSANTEADGTDATPETTTGNRGNGANQADTPDVQTRDAIEEEPDYDTESEDEIMPVLKPSLPSENRRRQNAIFESHMRQNVLQRVEEASKITTNLADEKLSTRQLMQRAEGQKIISSPRDYQLELFEKAKEQNTIAVLDTGSGKTLIAVLLLKHVIDQELEDREQGKPHRISFFLVDSVSLVFQQHAVLEANLDQNVEKFCGDMGCDLWDKNLWTKQFSKNMVIVCTAEVLYQCLHHAFVTMKQINLLIFDEAHHAKKNHSYARLMKDFYASEIKENKLSLPRVSLPRVFGMTASPVDSKTDIQEAAKELETLLHCRIVTASDASLLKYVVSEKKERIVTYRQLEREFETPLYRLMKQKIGDNKVMHKVFGIAKEASSQLGSWCADRVWAHALGDEEVKKIEEKIERLNQASRTPVHPDVIEKQIKELRQAQNIVRSQEFGEVTYNVESWTSEVLSSKVMTLMQALQEHFERPTDSKCIVFVKYRYTAKMLTEVFRQPHVAGANLRVAPLVGTRSGESGDLNLSFREQVLTMLRFRKGEVNCLFATSVAEEGLDIPDCNLVIRFDLYRTVIQYIQSKGRARQTNSRFLHFIEAGNRSHESRVHYVVREEKKLREFCQGLPPDQLLMGNDHDLDYYLAKEKGRRVHTEQSTGAKLTYRMSIMVLANFVASLPTSAEINLHPEYTLKYQDKLFTAEVTLPEGSPIPRAVGKPAGSKQVAKCSAAFEACLRLREGKFLDEHLLPIFTKQLPIMRNAMVAVDDKKREQYEMRTKPTLWSQRGIPEELFLTVIKLANPENLDRPSQPLGILSRSPLPDFPSFPLFFGKGRQSSVLLESLKQSIKFEPAIMDKVLAFTLRIFLDVFSKDYKATAADMPYFFVPIKEQAQNVYQTINRIDWEVVDFVFENKDQQHKYQPEDFFEDKYVADPYDGSRKLWAVKVTHDYKPRDPVPPNTATRKSGRNKCNDSILEYSCSLWANARGKVRMDDNQPVFEAEYISLKRNLLDETAPVESEGPTKCFICPQFMVFSALPTKIVAMAYTLPAIFHRVESYMIALEAFDLLHLKVSADIALEAVTKDSHNTDEHGQEQINFQRGMGNNYERLEFIGDTFLKMACGISVFTLHPTDNEFSYHTQRMLMICNGNLGGVAKKLKLYEYIRSNGFDRRQWYPEGLILTKGKGGTSRKTHSLGDKTIADVSEAIIGAAYCMYRDSNNMDMAVRAVAETVCSEDHPMIQWKDYYEHYEIPKWQKQLCSASQRDMAAQIEKKHPYHFNYPRLLRSAFLHPSHTYSSEGIPSYQRLEFLGDGLLDLASMNYLFFNNPDRDPQWLTEHKEPMIGNKFFAALAFHLGFHKHMRSMGALIQKQIREYVDEISEALDEAKKEAVAAGKPESEYRRDYWQATKDGPKFLGDLVEAYVGAVFVDSGYNFAEVEKFFNMHILPFFQDMTLYDGYHSKHPMSWLSHFLNDDMGCMQWKVFHQLMPDLMDGTKPLVKAAVMVHSTIVATDERESSRYAKEAVAKKAKGMLQGMSLPDFREEYGCDCRDAGVVKQGEDLMEVEEYEDGKVVVDDVDKVV